MSTIALKCSCGSVQGEAVDVTPSSGNRVICCCSDCQAFANHLKTDSEKHGATETLDKFGGTELFQMSQSQLKINQGHEHLQSMRLSKKGMLRWYASCCNTPIGNTMNAKMPFVGVIHSFTDVPDREAVMGPMRAVVQTQHAIGEPDYPSHSAKFPIGITFRIMQKLLVWKIQGKQKPSVFFGDDGRPVVKPIIVDESV